MIPAAVMMKLATLGLSPDHAEAVAQMLADVEQATKAEGNAAIETRRANDRERKSRQRHVMSRDITGQDVTERDNPPSPSLPPQTPPSRPHPPVGSIREREDRPSDRQLFEEFDREFWPSFPNRVGKGQAQKAWLTARRKAPLPSILAGVQRYVETKPADRPWCNPATFLNGERWMDEPAPEPTLRLVNGHSPPKSDRDRLNDIGRRMLAEERGETEPQHWQGGTIDGYAQRRQ